jgi:hypothetical protein
MPNAITATDQFLEEISGKLTELLEILRPEQPAAAEPAADSEPEKVVVDGAAKADEPARKPAKKAASKRTSRRRVDGT